MTAPANKRRTHNAAARAASQRVPAGVAERMRPVRRSKYGQRLLERRKSHE